jgi:hypothetical protein
MILRTITCAICKFRATEEKPGDGWKGWGAIQGIELNGEENPSLCPDHLKLVADFADGLDKP